MDHDYDRTAFSRSLGSLKHVAGQAERHLKELMKAIQRNNVDEARFAVRALKHDVDAIDSQLKR